MCPEGVPPLAWLPSGSHCHDASAREEAEDELGHRQGDRVREPGHDLEECLVHEQWQGRHHEQEQVAEPALVVVHVGADRRDDNRREGHPSASTASLGRARGDALENPVAHLLHEWQSDQNSRDAEEGDDEPQHVVDLLEPRDAGADDAQQDDEHQAPEDRCDPCRDLERCDRNRGCGRYPTHDVHGFPICRAVDQAVACRG